VPASVLGELRLPKVLLRAVSCVVDMAVHLLEEGLQPCSCQNN